MLARSLYSFYDGDVMLYFGFFVSLYMSPKCGRVVAHDITATFIAATLCRTNLPFRDYTRHSISGSCF
jgi:hypothetical protein